MREIKFRVWIADYKKMIYPDGLLELSGNEGYGHLEQQFLGECYEYTNDETIFPLMQYTGLKDRNGKEIYEGDVVELPILDITTMENIIAQVEFRAPIFITRNKNRAELLDSKCKVTGNIYENPEVLKKLEEGII